LSNSASSVESSLCGPAPSTVSGTNPSESSCGGSSSTLSFSFSASRAASEDGRSVSVVAVGSLAVEEASVSLPAPVCSTSASTLGSSTLGSSALGSPMLGWSKTGCSTLVSTLGSSMLGSRATDCSTLGSSAFRSLTASCSSSTLACPALGSGVDGSRLLGS
jgi:hypothetical protein